MTSIRLTPFEARVLHDCVVHFSAFTADEMRDHLGWGAREMAAWERLVRKTDEAAT